MRKLYFSRMKDLRWGNGPPAGNIKTFPLLLILFALGVLAGSIAGLFSANALMTADFESYVSSDAVPPSFLNALWNSGKFFLLVVLASTSFLGVLVLPAAAVLRGYLIGCSVSALFAAWSYRGLLCAFAVIGLPALFTVPCFLIAETDAFYLSARILKPRGKELSERVGRIIRHDLVFIFVMILEALYSLCILPLLLGKI